MAARVVVMLLRLRPPATGRLPVTAARPQEVRAVREDTTPVPEDTKKLTRRYGMIGSRVGDLGEFFTHMPQAPPQRLQHAQVRMEVEVPQRKGGRNRGGG